MLDEFLGFLDDKYGIAYNQLRHFERGRARSKPFNAQLKHLKKTSPRKKMWKYIDIKGFTMKKKDVNLGIIKNAFAYNVLTILNKCVYVEQSEPNKHRLVKEIEAQRYKKGKLDPSIKNDGCDSLEYALVPYYSNCYNLSFPIRKRNYEQEAHYTDIKKLAGFKK